MQILKLVKLEYKRYISNKILVLSMVLLPIIIFAVMLGIMKYINTANLQNCTIGIVNEDKSEDMNMLMAVVENTDSVTDNATLLSLEYDAAIEKLKKENIDMVVKIPSEFTRDIYYGEKSFIEIIENKKTKNNVKSMIFKKIAVEGISLGVYSQRALDIIWDSMNDVGYTREEIREAYNNNATTILLNIVGRNKMFDIKDKATYLLYYLSLILVVFIYINGLLVFITVNNDENNEMLHRFKINNINFNYYILSKFIVATLVQMVLYGIPLFIIMYFFKVLTFKAVLSIIIISFCSNSIMYFITKLFKNKITVVSIYLGALGVWILTRNSLMLNPFSKSVYILIDIFKGEGAQGLNELMMFIVLIFILDIGITIKNNYFTIKLKRG